jgi:octaprenyl-diphosphate synthase
MQFAKNILTSELNHFDAHFANALKSDIPLLNEISDYLLKHKGKQIRPLFSLLCSRLGGEVNEVSYRAAMVVEMLHTASLLHDDVLDESLERRGAFSINAIWKSKAAIFAGDTISLNALLMTLSNKDYESFEIYTSAIEKIVNGEIVQLKKTLKLNLEESAYFEIIKAKTAAFFAAACAAGAASTFKEELPVQKLHVFGEKTGVAFQLKDDLLDYGKADIGKPTGNDIKNRKLTLPLIYAINNSSRKLSRKLLHILGKRNKDQSAIDFVMNAVNDIGGIRYTHAKMLDYRDEALKVLSEFPESDPRKALEELVRYITDRAF